MSNTLEPGLAKSTGFISIAAGICGLGNCICGFMWLSYNGGEGHGLWSGFALLLPAALGLFIWRYRNRTLMIFFLVTCIVLVIVLGVQTFLSAVLYRLWRLYMAYTDCRTIAGKCYCRTSNGDTTFIDLETCDLIETIDSLFLAITIFSGIGAIISLAGSIMGCIGTCCAISQHRVVVVQQPSGT